MDCLEVRSKLLFFVELSSPGSKLPGSALSESEADDVRLHLETCPCCRRRTQCEERFWSAIRERLSPRPVPPGLRRRIRSRLAAVDPREPARRVGLLENREEDSDTRSPLPPML